MRYELEPELVELEGGEGIEVLEPEKPRQLEHRLMLLRNGMVLVAALLFLISLNSAYSELLKGVAYFFGAVAYGSELAILTDCFNRKKSWHEMFMPGIFGVLYVVLGVSYVLHHIH